MTKNKIPTTPIYQQQSLSGKHALVTGGTRGIGLATAQALLEHGAKVTIVARKLAGLKKAAVKLSMYGD